MQCMENSGCFPRGKRAAIVRRYPVCFFPVCSVFVFPQCFSVFVFPQITEL